MSLLLDARKKVELTLQHSDAHTGIRIGIIPIALISGLALAAGGGYYIWREISPPSTQQLKPTLPPAIPLANAAAPPAAPTKDIPVESKAVTTDASINPDYPLGVGRASARHARPPDGTTSHSTRLPKNVNQVAGYLPNPLPQAGEGDKDSLLESHVKVVAPPTPPAAPAAQLIRIEHAQDDDAVDPTLLAAYQAYRNGDFDTARQNYSAVLRKDAQARSTPNRDALLGMAAIAQQQSQDATAARYYRQVLVLDPRDPAANAGMSSLLGISNVAGAESRLKFLLAQQPPSSTHSASLHFALGNLYAEQSRWSDAQKTYFNAYNLEPGNAQFAFNLAVSLDHLGQGKLAAQHYQHALQLDISDNPGFNRAQTQQRINELTMP